MSQNKKAIILHGTDGSPSVNWLPWAKKELEKRGFEVWVPLLPDNHSPNRATYEAFLRTSNWDFGDTVVIGHSSGATTVLNLLGADWFPDISAAILVGTFLNERALKGVSWYEPGQFDNLFPSEGFNLDEIRNKPAHIYFIHGNDDPYCLLEDTLEFADSVNGLVTIVEGGLHLSSNRTELPELLPILGSLQENI